MRMNTPEGKRLLAAIRDGDFAHAGEEEAVDLAWEPLPKSPRQECLDAGCGRGGTAARVQQNLWGRVTGVDIDGPSISEAMVSYPEVRFLAADITRVGTLFPGQFDLIYAFNAFYAFPDQAAALRALREAARPLAQLCLFDYVDRGGFRETPFAKTAESHGWQPFVLESVPEQFAAEGWEVGRIRALHEEYRRWYLAFTRRFARRRADLEKKFPADLVDYAFHFYRSLLQAVEDGALGGAIVYAAMRDSVKPG